MLGQNVGLRGRGHSRERLDKLVFKKKIGTVHDCNKEMRISVEIPGNREPFSPENIYLGRLVMAPFGLSVPASIGLPVWAFRR